MSDDNGIKNPVVVSEEKGLVVLKEKIKNQQDDFTELLLLMKKLKPNLSLHDLAQGFVSGPLARAEKDLRKHRLILEKAVIAARIQATPDNMTEVIEKVIKQLKPEARKNYRTDLFEQIYGEVLEDMAVVYDDIELSTDDQQAMTDTGFDSDIFAEPQDQAQQTLWDKVYTGCQKRLMLGGRAYDPKKTLDLHVEKFGKDNHRVLKSAICTALAECDEARYNLRSNHMRAVAACKKGDKMKPALIVQQVIKNVEDVNKEDREEVYLACVRFLTAKRIKAKKFSNGKAKADAETVTK